MTTDRIFLVSFRVEAGKNVIGNDVSTHHIFLLLSGKSTFKAETEIEILVSPEILVSSEHTSTLLL